MSTSKAPVEIGQILEQKYRIDRILGVGGMGVVVAATHIHLDERVAIKFLLPEANEKPDVVARFAREARAAVKIKGEHVARVSDVGTLSTGEPYMVMEYLHGNDLADEVQARGKLPPSRAVGYVLQACEALAEAHAAGIVHRDLKPANLFLTQRTDGTDCIKVLDFGISKMSTPGASDAGMTKTQSAMGSPLYMSPEQMRSSKNVDARADIWSVGIVLYELLSGAPPFHGESLPEVCAKILQETPPSLVPLGVDPGLDAVVQRCLEKSADARHATVAELASALLPFAEADARLSVERILRLQGGASSTAALSTAANASTPAGSAVGAATTPAITRTISSVKPPAPSRTPLLAVVATLALAGVVGLGMAFKSSANSEAPTGQPAALPPSAQPSAQPSAPLPVVSVVVATSATAQPDASATAPQVSASAPVPSQPPAVARVAGPKKDPPPKGTPAPPPSKGTDAKPPLVDRRGDDRH